MITRRDETPGGVKEPAVGEWIAAREQGLLAPRETLVRGLP
jgi:hypothetical protein